MKIDAADLIRHISLEQLWRLSSSYGDGTILVQSRVLTELKQIFWCLNVN